MNKKLVKDNAKSFNDREGHSRDLIMMRCARGPKALPLCHIHAFIPVHLRSQKSQNRTHAAAFVLQLSRRIIFASAFTPPHAHRSICRRMHAAAFTPLSRSSIGAVALTLQRWCRRSDHARMLPPRTQQHCLVAASHARCSIHARRSICRRIHTALAGALCRWKRTTRSAFFNAEHDAGGREPARAGAGRGGGRFLKRGVLGWGGGAFYVRTYPRKGCVTAE